MYVDTSSAALESSGDRVTAARDVMSQTWSDKLRAGRQSLCGGDAASSTPRRGGVAVRITVKHPLTLSEQEECWGSSRTLRGTASVKESTCRSSTQECSATQTETVLSQQRVAQKSIPNCREGSPGRSEKNEKSIAQLQGTSARYKAEMVTTAIDPATPMSDDHLQADSRRR